MELNVTKSTLHYFSFIFGSENLPMTKSICGKWGAQFDINTLPILYQKHIQRMAKDDKFKGIIDKCI